ncbi:MAG: hypothetical protein JWM33_1714 [Caulobacteraceae bacterium]|nr:hypothetical protein [Caulobacteraceae bacterium]
MAGWEDFYVIVGSSAGALIGLQFVVLTLIAERPQLASAEASAAFVSPTIVHLCAVLLLSAIAAAPWPGRDPLLGAWGLTGVLGLVYGLYVTRRMRAQNDYAPQAEDWLCHSVLPLLAYGLILLSVLAGRGALGPFGVAAAALLLLFVSIHNAWDSTAYNVFSRASGRAGKK